MVLFTVVFAYIYFTFLLCAFNMNVVLGTGIR